MALPKILIRQIKAARALLGWSQDYMAAQSGVSVPTVKRLESVEGPIGGRPDTAEKIIRALEAGGVEFTDHDQPGVRMRKRPETVADLTDNIASLEARIPEVDEHAKPSPEKAMQELERAHLENEIVKANSKRAELKPKASQKPEAPTTIPIEKLNASNDE